MIIELNKYYEDKNLWEEQGLWTHSVSAFLEKEGLEYTPQGIFSISPLPEVLKKKYLLCLKRIGKEYSLYSLYRIPSPEGKEKIYQAQLCNKVLFWYFGDIPEQIFVGIYE
jgi:hypothetical protein